MRMLVLFFIQYVPVWLILLIIKKKITFKTKLTIKKYLGEIFFKKQEICETLVVADNLLLNS